MEAPQPFITTNPLTNKWEMSQETVQALLAIPGRISVVAIVGKYRTGKSYLMNRIFQRNTGFALGSTTQAKTKGIWIWAQPHPRDSGRCLILLDTEGLLDPEKGDNHHDVQLFIMAVLLCNCLVYNAVGTLDEVIIQQLRLVAELTEHIKIKRGTENEDEGFYFSKYFPSFFLVLRDFFLDLRVSDEEVTPDQYLEHNLRPRPGTSRKTQEYNAPRDCIKTYFPKRRCFTFVKPVNNEEQLRHMDDVPESEIRPEFLESCRKFVDIILKETDTFKLDGTLITTRRFTQIAAEYVRSINEGAVPCIESTVELMKNNECKRAIEEALQAYEQMMGCALRDKMPVENEVLLQIHDKSSDKAVDYYRSVAVFDEQGAFIEKLVESMDATKHRLIHQNNESSREKSLAMLQNCFQSLEQAVAEHQFAEQGAYDRYIKSRDRAVDEYNQAQGLGPMASHVLNDYLENKQSEERAILAADQALQVKEKQLLEEREQAKREAEKARLAEIRQAQILMQFEQEKQERDAVVRKMQEDLEEKYRQSLQEHEADLQRKSEEQRKLVEEGLTQQAEQYKLIIEEMKKDRKQMEDSMKLQTSTLDQYKKQHKELTEEIKKQRVESEKQIAHLKDNQLAAQLLLKAKALMPKMEQLHNEASEADPQISRDMNRKFGCSERRSLAKFNDRKQHPKVIELNKKFVLLQDQIKTISNQRQRITSPTTIGVDDLDQEINLLNTSESDISRKIFGSRGPGCVVM